MNEEKKEHRVTIQENESEPIFVFKHRTISDDYERITRSIYHIFSSDQKLMIRGKFEEDWYTQMKCVQEWFIRCSWINKYLFLKVICKATKGCFVLKKVLESIHSIVCKDILESLTSLSTDYDFDRILIDENRTLAQHSLKERMKLDFFWFVNLDQTHQVSVILRLLRLGGGGLIYQLCKLIQKILEEREMLGRYLSAIPLPKTHKTTLEKIKSDLKPSTEVSGPDSKRESLDVFSKKKFEQFDRRQSELQNYKKMRGINEDEGKSATTVKSHISQSLRGSTENRASKKSEEVSKQVLDQIQILPIWLNRRILSFVDDASLPSFKKVGKYWQNMIDDLNNEKTERKAINAKINKIMAGKKVEKKITKITPEKGEFEYIVELGPSKLQRKKNALEHELLELKMYEMIFSKKIQTHVLDACKFFERVCAFDNRLDYLASSAPGNKINFYCIRTETRFTFSLTDLESTVTCLLFHEDKLHLFIGFIHGSLIAMNIRTDKNVATFNGHTNQIIALYSTSLNLLSASRDNTIKYFQLWSGLCLLCIDLNSQYSITSLLFKENKPSCAIIGTKRGYIVLVDLKKKQLLFTVKLHNAELSQIARDGDFLITGSVNGFIRVWDYTKLSDNMNVLKPFYNIDIGCQLTYLVFHSNQIFAACANGNIKVISLVTGDIIKTLRILRNKPIFSFALTKDRINLKLIVSHEGGIEIRLFTLSKWFRSVKLMGRDMWKSKPKQEKKWWKPRTSDLGLTGFVRASGTTVSKGVTQPLRRTVFLGTKKSLKDRETVHIKLRKRNRDVEEIRTDVFSEVLNSYMTDNDHVFTTFPRYKAIAPS